MFIDLASQLKPCAVRRSGTQLELYSSRYFPLLRTAPPGIGSHAINITLLRSKDFRPFSLLSSSNQVATAYCPVLNGHCLVRQDQIRKHSNPSTSVPMPKMITGQSVVANTNNQPASANRFGIG
jgi:hypothetical protein